MMSNKGLNSNEALDESTATNSSVTLSGIRREKEAPTDLDITDYSRNPGNSEPGLEDRSRRLTPSYHLIVFRQRPLRSTTKHSAQVAIPTLRLCRSPHSLTAM